MFGNLRIGSRLMLLIIIQVVILAIIGAVAIFGLNYAAQSTNKLNANVIAETQLSYMAGTLQGDLLGTVNRVNSGGMIWADGRENLSAIERQFEQDWQQFTQDITDEEEEFIEDTLEPGLTDLRAAFKELKTLFDAEDRNRLSLYVLNDLSDSVDPFLNALLASNVEQQLAAEKTFMSTKTSNRQILNLSLGAIIAGVILAVLLGVLIYRSINAPISRIADTVQSVTEGDFETRTELRGEDELSQLGQTVDGLLDDRFASLVSADEENQDLNASVINLLDAVSQLSDRDLTVQVPVAQDVTGPVADAINQMAEETGGVLKQVQGIAQQVETSATTVNEKAASVNRVAESQRQEIERTAAELADASQALMNISTVAAECNTAAEQASQTTHQAVQSVGTTLRGMNEIRDAIQETGKRMKRLGERSNEITGIVDIINTIAERTHVLALNASMQAAAAGDAGRGFAVVAEEVQRLAENSREATGKISGLVRNIQIDTTDTISTMDRTIAQVVEGSRLAEAAGRQMSETQETTGRLVEAVRQIAQRSQEQANLSTTLRDRASEIVERTRATAGELVEQLKQTNNLVEYAKNLLSSVRVFKLPG